jgi:DNA-binding PadR family transcriptional regulator
MSLQHVLLALLSKEPNTGYGVGRLLRFELGHLWEARLQQIYGELAKLEAAGLLVAEIIDLPNRPAKKIYSLTAEGKAALDAWLLARPAPVAHKDDLLVRLYCLDRLPAEFLARRLDERHDEATQDAERLTRQSAQISRTDPAQLGRLLALDASLARAQAEAAWCRRAAATLREHGAVPAEPPTADKPLRKGGSEAVA